MALSAVSTQNFRVRDPLRVAAKPGVIHRLAAIPKGCANPKIEQ